MKSKHIPHRLLVAAALFTGFSVALTGCAGSSNGSETEASDRVSQAEIDKAMSTETTITYWANVPGLQEYVDRFEEKYPAITVNLEEVADRSVKLRTALDAGTGAPDVAQIDIQGVPSYIVNGDLLDLRPYGAEELGPDYVDWAFEQMKGAGGEVFALPWDSGPVGMLWREDLLAEAGIDGVPTTWEEFAADAETYKAETGQYLGVFGAETFNVLFWQKGLQPFSYDGAETVGIDVNSDEATAIGAYWQDLISRDLIATDPGFTDQWFQGLNTGKYASVFSAAWLPLFIQEPLADTVGKWSVTELPQWEGEAAASGNYGGSANAVLATSENPIPAYELVKFISHEQENAKSFAINQSLFPVLKSVLADADWSGKTDEFFGGQAINEVFAEISSTVDPDWQWLPFNDAFNTSLGDDVGSQVEVGGDIVAGLNAWQETLTSFALENGFTIR